jgi:hypothetical protein
VYAPDRRGSGALALSPFAHRGCTHCGGRRVEHTMNGRTFRVNSLTSFGRVRRNRITYPPPQQARPVLERQQAPYRLT